MPQVTGAKLRARFGAECFGIGFWPRVLRLYFLGEVFSGLAEELRQLGYRFGSCDGKPGAEVVNQTGKRQGQVLSSLALRELLSYHAEVQTDEESVKLLETFLDSAHPDWRDQKDESSAHGEETSPLSKKLSRDEAYQLLGLEAGCSEEDIRRAYHRLIKRVHPDSGGSAVLTIQITKARDRLLGDRH